MSRRDVLSRPARARSQVRAQDGRLSAMLFAALAAMAILLHSLTAHGREAPASFADLAERLLPSVVNISTTQTVKTAERGLEMPQFPPGSPLEDFFKEFLERQQGGRPDGPPRKATSLGSGFIIDPAGYIVTNNHVIADADEITVTLQDDVVFNASVVGRDPKTDLALLKIDPGRRVLSAVSFGNSDSARIGDWVLAIGNPFGLGGTVTAGIVSARARDINAGPYDDFLQTDAPINRGNSGGPMFNLNGDVIGINSAIFSPSGGSIGIGFAIPSSLARPVVDDLRKYGKTRRGWIGVRIQSLQPDIAESMGLTDVKGILVAKVYDKGPAAKAGIKPGDVIVRFDDRDIMDTRKFPRIVAETSIGKSVSMEVLRDGKRIALNVTIAEMVDEQAEGDKNAEKAPSVSTSSNVAGTGLTLSTITPALREKFSIDEETKGVVVVEVKDGPAAEKGLKPGDVITEAGNKPVRTPDDLLKAFKSAQAAGNKFLLLRVETPQSPRYVTLPTNPNGRGKK